MPGLRDLKNRIKSVKSTRKITKAMQMVSAAKMRKAQTAVMNSRTYAALAWDLVESLLGGMELEHPLLQDHPKAKKVGVVLLGSNRGLVGSLNSNLAKILEKLRIEGQPSVVSEVIIIYGKQARRIAQRTRHNILADFPKKEKNTSSEDIYPLAKYLTELYLTGEYKSIVVVYNQFISTLTQKPTAKQLLPFTHLKNELGATEKSVKETSYVFEPTPQEVVNHLLPRIIESQIYQAILESDASEHSARMVMMKNATEAAGDLIADYTLTYNQLRQNKITTELAEITAGKIALE